MKASDDAARAQTPSLGGPPGVALLPAARAAHADLCRILLYQHDVSAAPAILLAVCLLIYLRLDCAPP